MEAIENIWNGLDWSRLTELIISIIPSLVCITLHELSHGYVAYRLGDPTAKEQGRLTLNPIRHIDILGLIMMIVFKFGWAKPVPVNMYRFRNPKRGMAVTALAGPACNFLLGAVFFFLYGLLVLPLSPLRAGETILQMLYLTGYISLGLAIFNLLPIPPLDGSKVLFSVMPDRAYEKLMHYERYGMILLLVLSYTHVLGSPISTALSWLADRFFVLAELGFKLAVKFAGRFY